MKEENKRGSSEEENITTQRELRRKKRKKKENGKTRNREREPGNLQRRGGCYSSLSVENLRQRYVQLAVPVDGTSPSHARQVACTSSPSTAQPLLECTILVTIFQLLLPSLLQAPVDANRAAPLPREATKLKCPVQRIGNRRGNRRFHDCWRMVEESFRRVLPRRFCETCLASRNRSSTKVLLLSPSLPCCVPCKFLEY